jgi:hypothetical protein
MRGRRKRGMEFGRKTERVADTQIELGPVEVEMLKVLLGTVAIVENASIETPLGPSVTHWQGTIFR